MSNGRASVTRERRLDIGPQEARKRASQSDNFLMRNLQTHREQSYNEGEVNSAF